MVALAFVALCIVQACAESQPPPSVPADPVVPLDLQVRNSGLPAGYIWLSVAGQRVTGRWHRFEMAVFVCVTCPRPFVSAAYYEIAVFDERCQLRGAYRTVGGQLQVEIDPGPILRLVPAPPLGDWIPADSTPAEPATIPCTPL